MSDSFHEFLRKLKENFNSYMAHLKNKKLSSTNNAMENFFGIVFPDNLKKSFKTVKGVETFVALHIKRWNDRIIKNVTEFAKKYQILKKLGSIM
ncbi:MAG: hypothetical protein LBC39_08680 [Methanobrevibacter sp.]|jgi:hypothetical protein|nr:hypothetical protein [Candidatus Methanovirga aequatorialis]